MKRATYAEPTLELFPDEVDVELPLDDLEREVEDDPATTVDALYAALADVLAALEGGAPVPATRLRHYRTLVGRPAVVDQPATPEARRDEGIARAAAKWTPEEAKAVDNAIRIVAHNARILRAEFTTADVWQHLDGRVPVTKGIAGRMTAAANAGVIVNTGRTVIAPRDATGPNHGQRLTVWRAA